MPIPTAPNTPSAPVAGASAPAREPEQFQPAALVLAVVFPGLGHWSLGQRRRAPMICLGVLGLFVSGLLIGGVDCVDRRENPVWFAGQAIVGPLAWGVDWAHQNRFKVKDAANAMPRDAKPSEVRDADGLARPAKEGQRPPISKSLGKMNELGTLFAAVAGMLNLIVIVDAAFHSPRRARGGGR